MTIKYSFARGKTTYYQRGVPQDLRAHYGSKTIKIKVEDSDSKANLRLIARRIEAINREVALPALDHCRVTSITDRGILIVGTEEVALSGR
ncbi:MAG: hypothetical protein ACKVOX_08900 [Rhizobacter sp.]